MAALGTVAKKQKQLKCTKTDEWTQKIGYIYTVQDNSEIKDETMTFPVTGKKPEAIKGSEARQGKASLTGHHFRQNLEMDANELHYKRETGSQTEKRNRCVPRKKRGRGQGVISWFRSIIAH